MCLIQKRRSYELLETTQAGGVSTAFGFTGDAKIMQTYAKSIGLGKDASNLKSGIPAEFRQLMREVNKGKLEKAKQGGDRSRNTTGQARSPRRPTRARPRQGQ